MLVIAHVNCSISCTSYVFWFISCESVLSAIDSFT